MSQKDVADAETLMQQAGMTAQEYLVKAIRSIDEALGEGYAAKHPELIAAFMHTAALDFATTLSVGVIELVGESMVSAIKER